MARKHINFAITTTCNRACPECCFRIPYRRPQHFSAAYAQEMAAALTGFHTVLLTGGEPTCHPELEYIVEHAREWFQCTELRVETNAFKPQRLVSLADYFNGIYVTHYQPPEFPLSNTKEIDFLRARLPAGKLFVSLAKHLLNQSMGGTLPCHRFDGGDSVSCFNGQLYPCCVAWGIDASRGVPVQVGWEQALQRVEPTCDNCLYALVGLATTKD